MPRGLPNIKLIENVLTPSQIPDSNVGWSNVVVATLAQPSLMSGMPLRLCEIILIGCWNGIRIPQSVLKTPTTGPLWVKISQNAISSPVTALIECHQWEIGDGFVFYHDVGQISDLGQSGILNFVMRRIKVMQPTTTSHWRRGHSWPQFNVEENGFMKCYLKIYRRKGLTKSSIMKRNGSLLVKRHYW